MKKSSKYTNEEPVPQISDEERYKRLMAAKKFGVFLDARQYHFIKQYEKQMLSEQSEARKFYAD